jgi:uncharacterized membrane protein YbaN (DUF454 family)
MEWQIKKVVTLVVGWVLIAIGVVGLFLPFLQGILLILLGLYLLSRESEVARHWFERGRKRFPRVDARLKQWRRWWHQRLGRNPREEKPDADR